MILAARGMRNLDLGEETFDDKAADLGVRRIARKVHFMALLLAMIFTLLVWSGVD